MEQRRISNRSSLQPKSRIQDNDNVMINSSRVNKTQKKNKLKIHDHSEIDSFRVGERYREKLNGNSSSSCWKITSVSVKNNHKTLGQRGTFASNQAGGSVANASFCLGSNNKDAAASFSPCFPMKRKQLQHPHGGKDSGQTRTKKQGAGLTNGNW
jgi:hypothetical protein